MENVRISYANELYPKAGQSIKEVLASDNKYLLEGGQLFFDQDGIYVMTRNQITFETEKLYLERFQKGTSNLKRLNERNYIPLLNRIVWGSILLISALIWVYIYAKVFGF